MSVHDWLRQNYYHIVLGNGEHRDSCDTSTVQPILARTPVCQNCSSTARKGHKVSRAELCWVSMWWKPKHITLNPPHCPGNNQTKRLTHQPPPVPTFRHLWSGESVPITDWTEGASLIETNIMLLPHVWEWFNTGEREAAGMRVISNLTLHIPARIGKNREGGHLWICWMQTHLFVCVLYSIAETPVMSFFFFFFNKMLYK